MELMYDLTPLPDPVSEAGCHQIGCHPV